MDIDAWTQLACGALIILAIALACAWNAERKEKAYFERLAADLNCQLETECSTHKQAMDAACDRVAKIRKFVHGRHVTVMNKKTGRFGPFDIEHLDAVMDGKEIP